MCDDLYVSSMTASGRALLSCLLAVSLSIIVRRRRMGGIFGNALRQITTGPLSERVAELAAKAGQKQARLYVSQSARSQVLNAFALFGAGVVLTTPLVATLTRREVDAIAAHELSHLRIRLQLRA